MRKNAFTAGAPPRTLHAAGAYSVPRYVREEGGKQSGVEREKRREREKRNRKKKG